MGTRARHTILLGLALAMATLPARGATLSFDFLEVTPDRLFANSVHPGTPKGNLVYKGRAPGGTAIDIEITDDLNPPSPPVLLTVTPYPFDEPGDGPKAGDFQGYAGVTELGRHEVDPELVNQRPTLDLPPAQSVDPGSPITFTVASIDFDGDPVTLEAAGLPSGATFDGGTGVFSWTPSAAQAGVHSVRFAASDGRGGAAEGGVSITVTGEFEPNSAPLISAPRSKIVSMGESVSFVVQTDDTDGDSVGLTMMARPDAATLNTTTGAFSWTPAPDQAGNHTLFFVASDGRGGTASLSTTVSVIDLSRLGASQLTVTFTARNEDGDKSEPAVRTITKYAGTPGDTFNPLILTGGVATDPGGQGKNERTGPPTNWCHIVAADDGSCALSFAGLDTQLPWFRSPTGRPPTGAAVVQGAVKDLTDGSLGIASEISDVTVIVTDFRGALLTEVRSYLRTGPSAMYSAKLYINDYPPSLPGQPYIWRVLARDAWGNEGIPAQGIFNVFLL